MVGGPIPGNYDVDQRSLDKAAELAKQAAAEKIDEAADAKAIGMQQAEKMAAYKKRLKKTFKPAKAFMKRVQAKPEMAEKEEGVKAGVKKKKETLSDAVKRFPELNLKSLQTLKRKFEGGAYSPKQLQDELKQYYPDSYLRSQVIESLRGVTDNATLQNNLEQVLTDELSDPIARREINTGAMTDKMVGLVEDEGKPRVEFRKTARQVGYELMGLAKDDKEQTVEIKGFFNVVKTMQAQGYELKDIVNLTKSMGRLGRRVMKEGTMTEMDKRAQLADYIDRYQTMQAVTGAILEQKRHVKVAHNMLRDAGLQSEYIQKFTPEEFAWFVLSIAEQRYNSAENCDKMADNFVNKTIRS